MKKTTFQIISILFAIIWSLSALLVYQTKGDFRDTITIAGISIMFAWMAAQESIEDKK